MTQQQLSIVARPRQRGSATVVALLVLGLLTVFVATALTRNTNEALAMRNDSEEGRTFYAAQASLESMTRNFNKVFETRLNPTASDVTAIQSRSVLGFESYAFNQTIQPTATPGPAVISGGDFAGLTAIRDTWTLRSVSTAQSGTQVQLTRNFYNNRIPIFQFGIFYDGDLSLFNPPPFYFGGRVHSNRNFYITPTNSDVKFDSRVSASGEIVTQKQRNGVTYSDYGNRLFIKNASGAFVNLGYNQGSVLGGPDLTNSDPDVPNGTANPAWEAAKAQFDGNLLEHVNQLKLPIRIASNDSENFGNIRMIKRGRNVPTGNTAATGGDLISATASVTTSTTDNLVVATERYYGKPGLRISLANSKQGLPGCANTNAGPVTDACGVRLDSAQSGGDQDLSDLTLTTANRGYRPLAMADASTYPRATAFNAYRAYIGKHADNNWPRQTWIKVEIVDIDNTTGFPKATDITRDFLSLGITEQAPTTTGMYVVGTQGDLQLPTAYYSSGATEGQDTRAILKLQRWALPGPKMNTDTSADSATASGGNYKFINSGTGWSVVTELNNGPTAAVPTPTPLPTEFAAHGVTTQIKVNGTTTSKRIVPFPIEMFDTREGIYNEGQDTTAAYGTNTVPLNGVMSLIDVDIANMRRFLSGSLDGKFPSGTLFATASGHTLRASDIPQSNGWTVYISDRRGDWVFEGDYGMEDVFGANDGVLQRNEDANGNNALDVGGADPGSGQARPYVWEGTRYVNGTVSTSNANGTWSTADTYAKLLNPSAPTGADRYATVNKDLAAFADHRYYRRGVRLIRGTTLPGQTDLSNPSNTKGFTIACEQAIYVLGNYNATGISTGSSTPTPASNYLPQAAAGSVTTGHVPASIAADQVAFLSNAWTDGNGWLNPFNSLNRVATATTYRFAMLSGAPKERLDDGGPAQGYTGSLSYNGSAGGVHNFINMREDWNSKTLNYCGSLINIFTSRNNTGAFKCCNKVYRPPTRNWTFDVSFLDPARIPPSTPMLQYIQITGFQRTNY